MRTRLATIAFALILAYAPGPAAANDEWPSVLSSSTAFTLHEDTRQKDVQVPAFWEIVIPNGAGQNGATLTTRIQNAGVDPRDMGARPRAGRVKLQYGCTTNNFAFRNLGQSSVKLKKWGVAIAHKILQDISNCLFLQIQATFTGNRTIPAGTSFEIDSNLLLAPEGWGDDCFDKNVLCLNDGRFQVEVDWRDFDGKRGEAVAFGKTDDSGLLYFFDPDNWEMLIKVLDGCGSPTDSFWVFYAATTDVEYTVTVTDTQANQTRQYTHPLGQPAAAITDTSAFATCP